MVSALCTRDHSAHVEHVGLQIDGNVSSAEKVRFTEYVGDASFSMV